MEVTYIFRKQRIGRNFSIEFIFKDLKSRLDKSIKTKDLVCPQFSEGIFKRIVNILYVSLNKGKGINHVTGDVHYTVLLLPKERTVLSIMDCGFMSGRKGLAAFFLKTFWLDLPVRKVKYVTTISEYTKKEVIKYTAIDPSKIIVIPVAINDIYKPVYKEFNTDNPRILQIGRAANKNFDRIIVALKGLKITLVCIGKLSAEEEKSLKVNDIKYENYFSLSDEEIRYQYEQCDIMMFPSTFEGFGMPIIEAQMIGRVVITSNITSMPEVAGEGACYVNPFSVQEIKNATIKLINEVSYREELIEKGKANAKRFDPDSIAKQYENLYNRIINS